MNIYPRPASRKMPGSRISARNMVVIIHFRSIEVFRELDPELWNRVEQHPRALLNRISELRLLQKAGDGDYFRKLEGVSAAVDEYLSAASEPENARIAYFCAEYGVHNSLPIY